MAIELNVERCYLVTRDSMGRAVNVAIFGTLADAERFAGGPGMAIRIITKAATIAIETERA